MFSPDHAPSYIFCVVRILDRPTLAGVLLKAANTSGRQCMDLTRPHESTVVTTGPAGRRCAPGCINSIKPLSYALVVALVAGCGGKPAPDDASAVVSSSSAPIESPAADPQPAPVERYDQQFELQGIGFHVSSPNIASGNTVTVVPTGLEIDNSPWESPIDGDVVGAEVGDLDANGSPEIYVYVRSRDSAARGSLVGYAANNRKSLSAIYLPSLSADPAAAAGYQGHDEFALVEQSFARRFPLYAGDGDSAVATGKTRQLQYTLTAGEAGWRLELVDSTEF
jgi:hypothetical protein